MAEQWLSCKKCGSVIRASTMALMDEKMCPKCDEPMRQAWDLDRADWSTPVITQGETDGT